MPDTFSPGDIAAVMDPASASASPADDAPVSSSPTPAATVPDETADSPVWTGAIPTERHQAILTKARRESAEAARSQVEQEMGWARGLNRERIQQMQSWFDRYASDPLGANFSVLEELLQHPQYGAQARSELAKRLSGLRQPDQAAEREPQADVVDQTSGQTFYSARQLQQWQAWRERQMTAQFDEKLQPFQQFVTAAQQATEAYQAEQQSTQWAAQTLAKLRQLPGFSDSEAEIKAHFAQNPPLANEDVGSAIRDAYLAVVMPKLSQTERQQVAADLQAKARPHGTRPGRAVAGSALKAMSWRDALKTTLEGDSR